MTNEENARLDRIERILEKLAATAERHNEEIHALIQLTSDNTEAIRQTWEAIRNLEQQWQAYLTTIHPQQ
ncbi:MAG TPA: hypothetical protein VKU19_14430 [Bryobacteraceae bacterium]|nr:hypothetical protein [Bryobacteraceae bacterium]